MMGWLVDFRIEVKDGNMKRIVSVILWLILSNHVFSDELFCSKDPALSEKIGQLNNESYYTLSLDSSYMKNPRNTACILINNLKPIKLDLTDNKFWNVISSLALLEELTCTSMRGKTKYTFQKSEEDRKSFLDVDVQNEVNFVGNHMSTGEFFLAPNDAQEEIIKKWQLWYLNNSEKYSFKNLETNKCGTLTR
jgi:hypothetical protein